MTAAEQYFPLVLFMLYKVVLPFDLEDEILKFVNSNDSNWAAISCGILAVSILIVDCKTVHVLARTFIVNWDEGKKKKTGVFRIFFRFRT